MRFSQLPICASTFCLQCCPWASTASWVLYQLTSAGSACKDTLETLEGGHEGLALSCLHPVLSHCPGMRLHPGSSIWFHFAGLPSIFPEPAHHTPFEIHPVPSRLLGSQLQGPPTSSNVLDSSPTLSPQFGAFSLNLNSHPHLFLFSQPWGGS